MDARTDRIVTDLRMLFDRQRQRSRDLKSTSSRTRRDKLRRLKKNLLAHRLHIREALYSDFRKPPEETDLSELTVVLAEIEHTARHLRRWMQPRRLTTPLPYIGTSAICHVEPKGVVLIISPWNYPLNLSLAPLVSAVAAGNCVILKPSELAPATSTLMRSVLGTVFDDDEVAVIEGDKDVASALLELPFDHIFFTGSPHVGRIVMQAAASLPTSVTLELGGKSPAIVDETADINLAARRIAFGKISNAGQTCVAPDYLLVARGIYDRMLEALAETFAAYLGDEDAPQSLASIINAKHLDRLERLIEDAVSRGAKIVTGGRALVDRCTLLPTLLTDVADDSAVLQEEIFGPVLPIIPYDTMADALQFVNARPPALTLYLFSSDRDVERMVRRKTTTGSILVNDTLFHFGHPEMPFGGVHQSGIGRSHGYAGFMAFSNERPVMRQLVGKVSIFDKLHPPYTRTTRFMLDVLLRWYGR